MSYDFDAALPTAITDREMVAMRWNCLTFLAENGLALKVDRESLVPLAEAAFAFVQGEVKTVSSVGLIAAPSGNVMIAQECLKMAASSEFADGAAVLEKAAALKEFILPRARKKEEPPVI